MVSYYFPTLEYHLPLAPQGKADGTGGALHTNAKARLFIIDFGVGEWWGWAGVWMGGDKNNILSEILDS